MRNLLIRLVINAAALWAAIELVPGLGYEGDVVTLFIISRSKSRVQRNMNDQRKSQPLFDHFPQPETPTS